MTTIDIAPSGAPSAGVDSRGPDHRGSWVPNLAMIRTRLMELRKRRGLMAALLAVYIGLPAIYLLIKLILHAADPATYGPAGGYDTYTGLIAGVLYVFGFIVAATLGCAAGSTDLSEGMFRHLVVTGRSRLALYLARIPAGLAIVIPIVAAGFALVCTVCVLAAPTTLNYNGVKDIPVGLSRTAFVSWAEEHPKEVICNFPFDSPVPPVNLPCIGGPAFGQIIEKGRNGVTTSGPAPTPPAPTQAQLRTSAADIARADYADYSTQFLTPPVSLMIKSGLWLVLAAVVAFIVGLGLSSLIGQRTISVIMIIILEVVITPIMIRSRIPHFINLQRADVGLALEHIEPHALPAAFSGGGNAARSMLLPESTLVAVCVLLAWLVGWTALGAWRMVTRDA
jgi:hypothetical protein